MYHERHERKIICSLGEFITTTIEQLQAYLSARSLTSEQLVQGLPGELRQPPGCSYADTPCVPQQRIQDNNEKGLELYAVVKLEPRTRLMATAQHFDVVRDNGVHSAR